MPIVLMVHLKYTEILVEYNFTLAKSMCYGILLSLEDDL